MVSQSFAKIGGGEVQNGHFLSHLTWNAPDGLRSVAGIDETIPLSLVAVTSYFRPAEFTAEANCILLLRALNYALFPEFADLSANMSQQAILR